MPATSSPTRERLLDEAMRLFGERGYDATSVAEIERSVGLTPGAGGLFHHFRTKEAVLVAGIDRHLARLEAVRQIRGAIPPLGDLRVEPYTDYEPVHTNAVGNFDKTTWKIFAGYEFRKMAVGMEALDYVKRQGAAKTQEPAGYSVYARGAITPTLSGVARYDRWYSDRNNGNRIDNILYIAGVDWQPFKDVHFMPNVEATQYVAKGTAVAPSHHDLQARLTFYYKFVKPQS